MLTDYEAIRLAQELGIVSRTGAIRLRHTAELLSHFATPDTEEELSKAEGVNALRACVAYVLAAADLGVAMDFAKFRRRLEKETLAPD